MTVRRCAFITRDELTADDALVLPALSDLGWQVEALPWRRQDVDWNTFDAAVIRSPWDYHRAPSGFLAAMTAIPGQIRLENPIDLVRWNMSKTYLHDLAAANIPIVPTTWRDCLPPGTTEALFHEVGSDDIVVKPVVSASAHGSFRLRIDQSHHLGPTVEQFFRDTPLMAQPLVTSVLTEGEYSLFYFDGRYSHAVLKTPASGDYRVQEEYGGATNPFTPDHQLLGAADETMAVLSTTPLYARVDLARGADGGFWLMELELIEPVLYLGKDPGAARRFAEAFAARHPS